MAPPVTLKSMKEAMDQQMVFDCLELGTMIIYLLIIMRKLSIEVTCCVLCIRILSQRKRSKPFLLQQFYLAECKMYKGLKSIQFY